MALQHHKKNVLEQPLTIEDGSQANGEDFPIMTQEAINHDRVLEPVVATSENPPLSTPPLMTPTAVPTLVHCGIWPASACSVLETDFSKFVKRLDFNRLRYDPTFIDNAILFNQNEPLLSAKQWLNDDDALIVFTSAAHTRAVPENLLKWHLAVSLNVGNDTVVVTHCPFCGENGRFRAYETAGFNFHLSGLIYGEKPVLIDEETHSLWVNGLAIAGTCSGQQLHNYIFEIESFGSLRTRKSDFQAYVVKRPVGNIEYIKNPYPDWGPQGVVNIASP